MYKPERVLFLSAHPDDELNVAGTLHKFRSQSVLVSYTVFSNCSIDSIELGVNPLDLDCEMDLALDIIDILSRNRYSFLYKARYFPEHRQSICHDMFSLNKQLSPDLVIVPNTKDLHQDHCVIRDEARRAFRQCSILGYESTRAPIGPDNLLFIELGNGDIQAKERVMECYQTQSSRINIEVRMDLCKVRGSQIGCEYAEAFEVIRLIS